jgi:hypothetical protein
MSSKENPRGWQATPGSGESVAVNNCSEYCQATTQSLVSGFGGYHTADPAKKNPKPYTTINFDQIKAMAENPLSVPKDTAQWLIPSSTGGEEARGHAFQREKGDFHALWADLDEVQGSTFQEVEELIKQAIPEVMALVYTTRSATAGNPKCRIIIPLAMGIPGVDYSIMAKILNDRLEAAGLMPDRATERTGQLCYLPNRGEFYQYTIIDGEILNSAVYFAEEIQEEHVRLRAEAEERERRHQESVQKIQARVESGQVNPVEAFKAAYHVELALERYGYIKRGNKWLSPRSESGNPGVSVKDGKWYSHHDSDSGIGQPGSDGGRWGDAFDLFAWYEHGGDFSQAVKAAGELFTTTDPETGEIVSITNLNQRQYMRAKNAPVNDFHDHQATQVEQEVWDTITPLDGLEVDSLDPDSLPGIIREYALAVMRETETPLELSAGMIFVVIATCVQRWVKIEIKPGYTEPLSFWAVTPMDPATRKSQVLKRATKPLTDWEERQRFNLKKSIKIRRIERENTFALIKALRTKFAKAKPIDRQAIEDEIIDLEDTIEPEIVAPQLWAQDCTPENTAMIMAKNHERVSVIAAEGGILDTLGGRYNSGVANLDLYLQSFSGDSVKVNRVNRDDIFLNDPALSLGLLPQPQVIKALGAKAEFTGRGFMGRPLYFIPKSNLGNRTLDTEPIPEQTKKNYIQTVNTLLKLKPIENSDGTTDPHILKLSPEAFQEWRDFYNAIERNMATGCRFEHCRDWAGKTPGRAARLAGLFHCAINPVEPWLVPVSLETMEQALDVTTVSCDHALKIFSLMGSDPSIEAAGRVLEWITKCKHQEFTKKQAFDSLRGTFPRVKDLADPLAVLLERNYIRAITDKGPKKPGRKSEVYQVNPAVCGDY